MAYAIANRVFETSTSTGTGSFNLAGSTTGFQTFVAGIGDGNTCNYFISNDTDWEAGIGTITSGSPDVLSRDTVLESSNADAKVNWGSGTKNVYIPFLAQNTVITNKDNIFSGSNTFTGKLTKSNDTFITGRNAADNANVDIVKVNASDQIELGGELRAAGKIVNVTNPTTDQDAATKKYVDDEITAIPLPLSLAVPKVGANFNGAGSVTVAREFGVSSIVRNAAGDYTVNFDNNFANTNYIVLVSGVRYTSAGSGFGYNWVGEGTGTGSNKTISSFTFRTGYAASTAFEDLEEINIVIYGELA